MFYEWVSAGAIFGIEAFFAIFTFAMCCAAVLGCMVLAGRIFRFGGRGDEDRIY